VTDPTTNITIDPETAPDRIRTWLGDLRPLIDDAIERHLPLPSADPGRLVEAMRYAVLGPGKRLRPAMAIAACEAVGGSREAGLPAAVAVETLHAYTLVHDDLPAMDDDDERRGRPTVHVAFGEAIAVLAGDGLLTSAFASLARLGPGAAAAVEVLARRAGAGELLAGQARDLAQADHQGAPSLADLEVIHAGKTGALFSASAELGAIAGGAGDDDRAQLARYGMAVGIAFQHADDRDDGEFRELAAQARARRLELADEAAAIARRYGDRGRALLDLALWIGRS
jgi:geranylgeranyl pyrophosphate synthase